MIHYPRHSATVPVALNNLNYRFQRQQHPLPFSTTPMSYFTTESILQPAKSCHSATPGIDGAALGELTNVSLLDISSMTAAKIPAVVQASTSYTSDSLDLPPPPCISSPYRLVPDSGVDDQEILDVLSLTDIMQFLDDNLIESTDPSAGPSASDVTGESSASDHVTESSVTDDPQPRRITCQQSRLTREIPDEVVHDLLAGAEESTDGWPTGDFLFKMFIQYV